MKALAKIQKELKAPKNQRNNFGNYNYRSCEDILEAVKPYLDGKDEISLIVNDEIVQIGDRYYVKATAVLTDKDGKTASATAFAREPLTKKGMDDAQITGATSSYARKYALNGLFAIDDSKDADTNEQAKIVKQAPKLKSNAKTPSGIPMYDFTVESVARGNNGPSKDTSEQELEKLRKKYFAIAYKLGMKNPKEYIKEKLNAASFNDISETKLSAFVKALEMKVKHSWHIV